MKFLLLPLAWLYGTVVRVRNLFFQLGIFRTTSFDVPIIAVGNLRVGGTGKTPAILALISMFKEERRIAVLSRGYGRGSKGWRLLSEEPDPKEDGDEPSLIKERALDIQVAVCENRVQGVNQLLKQEVAPNLILLDDAMQHRWVKPGHLILLTSYHNRYTDDWLLPVGRLREHRSKAKRADTIVVTKCPENMDVSERRSVELQIKPAAHQVVCFAYESYPGLKSWNTHERISWDRFNGKDILLVTGLADATTLRIMLERRFENVRHIAFADHRDFSETDMDRITRLFDESNNPQQTAILTTEKDAVRIAKWKQNQKFAALPIYMVDHEMQWFDKDRMVIEERIHEVIRAY